MTRYADFTEEQKERYRQYGREYYARNKEAVIERTKAYNKTDKAVVRRKAYDMKPEQVAKRKARDEAQGDGYRKEYWEKIKSCPKRLNDQYAKLREWRTGMSGDMYDALLIFQNNACAICKKTFELRRKGQRQVAGKIYPCADHCHDGNGPRGLLCHRCNTIEGHIRSVGVPFDEFLQRLHDYLENPPVKQVSLLQPQIR